MRKQNISSMTDLTSHKRHMDKAVNTYREMVAGGVKLILNI